MRYLTRQLDVEVFRLPEADDPAAVPAWIEVATALRADQVGALFATDQPGMFGFNVPNVGESDAEFITLEARVGDYLVRTPDGDIDAYTPEEFAEGFEEMLEADLGGAVTMTLGRGTLGSGFKGAHDTIGLGGTSTGEAKAAAVDPRWEDIWEREEVLDLDTSELDMRRAQLQLDKTRLRRAQRVEDRANPYQNGKAGVLLGNTKG